MLLVPIINLTPFFSKDLTFGQGDFNFSAVSQERNPDERRRLAANIMTDQTDFLLLWTQL